MQQIKIFSAGTFFFTQHCLPTVLVGLISVCPNTSSDFIFGPMLKLNTPTDSSKLREPGKIISTSVVQQMKIFSAGTFFSYSALFTYSSGKPILCLSEYPSWLHLWFNFKTKYTYRLPVTQRTWENNFYSCSARSKNIFSWNIFYTQHCLPSFYFIYDIILKVSISMDSI